KTLQEKYLKENLPCFIGESKGISDVMQFVELAAKSPDTPIILLGQSGTGKDLIASAIHYRSPNFKGPLITINCAAIPKDLIESELFGYEKGAFSGAGKSGKKGLVEQAANGTLFLDEIGDLSLEAQAKLLRFLESGEFYRVGGTKKRCIKTRVVSATNKNLKEMIEKGLFREDLYFRVGVVKVEVPSLNERREDIIPIARHFLVEFSKKFGKSFIAISSEAEIALREFDWKGNVRELKNLIERAVLIAKGPELTLEDLSIQVPEPSGKFNLPQQGTPFVIPEEGVDLPSILESVEKEYIKEALRITGGNETKAAELLNLNYTTFRYRKKNYG
ncbi:MAG: sigma-54-dependent Fis family transcriptional regulator, partial [Deltaproteobacteria bacterium]|nr:sigma-54-dependent Fis family transcriptional regulator [Deltaproteobacteria bacterium]